MKAISSEEPYDALIFDNELPGIDGLELVRRTRLLPHRRQTPIVMLSASDIEREARMAGVDAFLRKPEDANVVAQTIAQLVAPKLSDSSYRGYC
jgi:CheY-like chemotaxis protein